MIELTVSREVGDGGLADTTVLTELLSTPREYLHHQEIFSSQYMRLVLQLAQCSRGLSVPGFWDASGKLFTQSDLEEDAEPFDMMGAAFITDPLCLALFAQVFSAQGLQVSRLYVQYPVGRRGSSGDFLADIFLSAESVADKDFALATHCRFSAQLIIPSWVTQTHHYCFSPPDRCAGIEEWNRCVLAACMAPRLLPCSLRGLEALFVKPLRSFLLPPVLSPRKLNPGLV